jgi:hypothetical protein
MKKPSADPTEHKCPACNGTGYLVVTQPAQPGRKIYPPIIGHLQSPSACLKRANAGSDASSFDHLVGAGEQRRLGLAGPAVCSPCWLRWRVAPLGTDAICQ